MGSVPQSTMHLVRFADDGQPRVGILEAEEIRDVTEQVGDFGSALSTVTAGETIEGGDSRDAADVTLLPPTMRENTTFAVALNYHSHIEEVDQTKEEFERPLVFMKPYRTLVGQHEPITLHGRVTDDLDYEGELAAVVGAPAHHVSPEEALDYVAGYTVLNDVTQRDLQYVRAKDEEWLDWFSAKAMEHTTPVGPAVVTTDEVPDPSDLHITTRFNGEVVQDEATELMIYDTAELVSYVSSRVTLQPGDVIATGTPKGVGHFQDRSLTDGDEVSVEIPGVGTLTNTVERVE